MTVLLPQRAAAQADRVAVIDAHRTCSYAELLAGARRVAAALRTRLGAADLAEARVAFLVPAGACYVQTQWGIWLAGGVAVPLGIMHPEPELAHVVADSGAAVLLADPTCLDRLTAVAARLERPLIATAECLSTDPAGELPAIAAERRALMLYTSGTTGKPKGVVTTHRNLEAQITALVEAWAWQPDDRILHLLPLHHVHGIVNALACALWVGAQCEIHPRFDPELTWQRLAGGDFSLYMGVPTHYARLIATWEHADAATQASWSAAAARLRLMVSGSAALPVSTLARWREICGHTLLERYGMTEIGMALSNPLRGERVAGTVGRELPGVEARIVDDTGQPVPDGTAGEIQVRGGSVFREYWQRPAETAAAFDRDGWFRTGDAGVREDGRYRILGRRSVDMLGVAGYTISALEIEEVLREHPAIAECAVVGVADHDQGQRVAAAVVPTAGSTLDLDELRTWAKERLAPYKVPSLLRCVDELPRNALGKVVKPRVTAELFPPAASP